VPPDLAVRGPSAVTHPAGTRSRGARCQPRAVLPSRGQAQGHPGPAGLAGPPLARWPQQGQPAAAGTPGHFPSHRNAATPGPCSAISRLEKAASEKGASPQSRLANMRRVMTGNPFCRGPARPANGGKSFARRRARWPTPAGRPGAAGPARLRRRRAGIRDNKQPRQTHDLQTGGAGCQHVGHEAPGEVVGRCQKTGHRTPAGDITCAKARQYRRGAAARQAPVLPVSHIGSGMLRGGFAAPRPPGPWNCV
jgi:hypothetical protein